MATGQWPTLADVASREGPNGAPLVLAEMLSQCNELIPNLPMVEANEKTGHEFGFRDSIPAGSWRSYNMGVGYSKTTSGKARIGIATLSAWAQIDRDLAEDSGDVDTYRESEEIGFVEGLSQTWSEALVYGNSAANPSQFMGLEPFYNTVNKANARNANNVIDAGGTASSNMSFILMGLNERTVFGVYPRASAGGLAVFDKGDTVPAYDSFGNPFSAWTTEFRWRGAICPQDWRNAVRIANIDTTNAGVAGPNAPDLNGLLADSVYLLPAAGRAQSGITQTDAPNDASMGVRLGIAMNRSGRHWLDIQQIRGRNTMLSINDYAGKPTLGWRDIPIWIVDQMVNTEARVV